MIEKTLLNYFNRLVSIIGTLNLHCDLNLNETLVLSSRLVEKLSDRAERGAVRL